MLPFRDRNDKQMRNRAKSGEACIINGVINAEVAVSRKLVLTTL